MADLEEKGSRKMARRVYEPRNGQGRRQITETEVEVVRTEVEEMAVVKVAAKVEPGFVWIRSGGFHRRRERVCSLLSAGGMHFEVRRGRKMVARYANSCARKRVRSPRASSER